MHRYRCLFLAIVSVNALLLSACGGGSDNSSSSASSNVQPTDINNYQKDVPVVNEDIQSNEDIQVIIQSNYAKDSGEYAAFNALNQARKDCGFGTLTQDSNLDKAVQNHSMYLSNILAQVSTTNNSLQINAHLENTVKGYENYSGQNNPYYTGKDVNDRIKYAGYDPSSYTENLVIINGGAQDSIYAVDALRGLMAAPYHMLGLFGNFRNIGIDYLTGQRQAGAGTANYAVFETVMGTQAGITTQRPVKQIVSYPCEGTTGTNIQLRNEVPNPFSDSSGAPRDLEVYPVGQPILVIAPSAQPTINQLQLTDIKVTNQSNNRPVSTLLLDENDATYVRNSNQVTAHRAKNKAFIVPVEPLQPNTAYRVSYQPTLINTQTTQSTTLPKQSFSFKTGNISELNRRNNI